jgi:hypothetical protein
MVGRVRIETWRIRCVDGRSYDIDVEPDDPAHVQYLLSTLRREAAYEHSGDEVRVSYFPPSGPS